MPDSPLHHIVRLRTSDDFTYVHSGLMDEVVVNANQLENSIQSTAAVLWRTTLPFSVDPVLWRFQLPAWSENGKGDTKRNYKRLGAAYASGTGLTLGAVPLLALVQADEQWRALGANVIRYQKERLLSVPTQLDLMAELRELRPVRLMAASLVAFSDAEDRINRLIFEASAATADGPVAAQVIVPFERLIDPDELDKVIASCPRDGVSSYFIWTPKVTEERLLADEAMLSALIRLVGTLAESGVPVGHEYANYTVFALRSAGIGAVTHHLGWTDRGEPAAERGGGPRSCQTYVPSVRHCLRFPEALALGRHLAAEEYRDLYCECTFCTGSFEEGDHPLDLLLQSQPVSVGERERLMPTSQAVGANTWHFLLSRRLEVEAFSKHAAADVIQRDIERASALRREGDASRLLRLATRLPAA
jgi:hypothetical protein